MQLIERLKQKQMRQRKAYQQLEAVLALGTRSVPPSLLLGHAVVASGRLLNLSIIFLHRRKESFVVCQRLDYVQVLQEL